MPFDLWYLELARLLAEAEDIETIAAARYIRAEEAQSWWADGFTPLGCFRENYFK